MPNHAYLRGRKAEWAVQRLFKQAGHTALRCAGSHGLADLVVSRTPTDALDLTKPLTIQDMDEVLIDWLQVQDRDLILPEFLYGRTKWSPRGSRVTIHMTPVSAWFLQLKTQQRGKG